MIGGVLACFLATPAAARSLGEAKVAALDARLHAARPADVEAIQNLFRQAHDEELAMQRAADDFGRNEGKVPMPDYEARREAAIKPYRDLRDATMLRAAKKTLAAYGLMEKGEDGQPTMPTGEVVDPLVKQYGMTGSLTWSVAFRDPPPRERVVAKGRRNLFGRDQKDLTVRLSEEDIRTKDGVTTSDGVTILWPEFAVADQNDPRKVRTISAPAFARLLHHELAHFYLKTSPGTGESLGPNREEAEVLKSDLEVISRMGFSPAELKAQEDSLKDRQRKAKNGIVYDDTTEKMRGFSARMRGFLVGNPVDSEILNTSVPGFQVSIQQMGTIRSEAQELNERVARAERDRREAETRAEYDRTHPQVDYSAGGCGGAEASLPSSCLSISRPSGAAASLVTGVAAAPQAAHAEAAQSPAAASAAAQAAFDVWAALGGLAARGCADPNSVGDDELTRVWPWIRPPSDVGTAAQSMGLVGCQLILFQRLGYAATDGRHPTLSAADFFAMASAARTAAAPPPIEHEPRGRQQQPPPSIPRCRFMGSWCDGSGG